MASNKVRYPPATAVVQALPCLQRTDMDAVALVCGELNKEVEVSPVLRPSFLRLRRGELAGWECACAVICQCGEAPGTERIIVEGTFTDLAEVFKHALRHSSASISFAELHFRDVQAAMSEISARSSVFALEFCAVDFSGFTADEFHRFVLAHRQLETLKLDCRCTTSYDYLTDSFLRECVAKRLVDVLFENIPSDAERYNITDKGILDFISYDADKVDRRCLSVAAAKVSQNFFKRLVQASTLGEGLGRAKTTEFCIRLESVNCDEQNVDDYEDYAGIYHWDGLVEFRFHELPLFVSLDSHYNTLYASNEADSCTLPSDFFWNCICGTLIVLLSFYILFF